METENGHDSRRYLENEEMIPILPLNKEKVLPRHCPLCRKTAVQHFRQDYQRDYLLCQTCRLIFVPAEHYISSDAEKAQYDRHDNRPDDPDYRAFLSRMFLPMQERLHPASCGLDFGSGPGPTLSVMFEEAGHRMAIYDHFFAPATSTLKQPFDFITATEVVEHLHRPGFELDRLWSLLKPGGLLGIMTQLVPELKPFDEWYYLKDPTHVCFFSRSTCEWLARHWHADLTYPGNNVMLFQKIAPIHIAE